MGDDFKYVLDENGHRVLVGLAESETVEIRAFGLASARQFNRTRISSGRRLSATLGAKVA
jgi:hypothetical protein